MNPLRVVSEYEAEKDLDLVDAVRLAATTALARIPGTSIDKQQININIKVYVNYASGGGATINVGRG